jgi:peptide deformylase
MAILPILTVPDKILREKCRPVTSITDDHRRLLDDMLETMYDAPGVGLAAPQIGVVERLLVVDPSRDDENRQPMKIINPEILWQSNEINVYNEGCLSIPEQFADIERPERIKLRYLDENGTPQELETGGFLATVIQHEIDHLNGIMFIDYLSPLRRNMLIKKVQKIVKLREDPDS